MSTAAERSYREAVAAAQSGDIAAARALHRHAADAGQADAGIELARMALHGVGQPPDVTQAVAMLERLAQSTQHPTASVLLAHIAIGGRALPRDGRIDQHVYAALQAGAPQAMRAVAIHFGRKPHADDQTRCIHWLEAAAHAGDTIAAALLAERLRFGEGTPADRVMAEELWTRLEAAGVPRLPDVRVGVPQQQPSSPGQLHLLDALQPVQRTQLCQRPSINTIDQLLSADECRLLIATATPLLQQSRTFDPVSGDVDVRSLRSSSDASFDSLHEDLSLRLLQLRLCAAAGIDLPHAERLIVLRYQPGEEYKPHRDYLAPAALQADTPQAGNRRRTLCVYLADVEDGGGTDFPARGITIPPAAGRAVVFDSLHTDGRPDPDSLHAGLPVVRGEKWLATLWFRQGLYRDF